MSSNSKTVSRGVKQREIWDSGGNGAQYWEYLGLAVFKILGGYRCIPQMVSKRLTRKALTVVERTEIWGSGALVEHTVACVVRWLVRPGASCV